MSNTDKLDNYISLSQSGRLFPSFIAKNFKQYKLDEMLKRNSGDDDPCSPKEREHMKELKLELRKYQLFVSQFMDYRSIYKGILLYHGLGSFYA
ncbi:hypothetical protein Klosneuvirus_2_230 [Klosneuvirus KNV1]|uniref:Uncharacterized protein n=1 Tax=Klosneuvirus KNV1 TaxID=1977640 RepID=A0A1V0SJH2_9VIRU|nr:hypothetical protein Klosneuvirus_2_230 [Klosneuvirus KNV1]